MSDESSSNARISSEAEGSDEGGWEQFQSIKSKLDGVGNVIHKHRSNKESASIRLLGIIEQLIVEVATYSVIALVVTIVAWFFDLGLIATQYLSQQATYTAVFSVIVSGCFDKFWDSWLRPPEN